MAVFVVIISIVSHVSLSAGGFEVVDLLRFAYVYFLLLLHNVFNSYPFDWKYMEFDVIVLRIA